VAEDGMRRVRAHVGLLQGPVPAPTKTRFTEIGGDDYYVYASDGGLFEPLVELGDEVKADQPAGRIHFHHTPWREPEVVRFKRAGTRRLPVPPRDGPGGLARRESHRSDPSVIAGGVTPALERSEGFCARSGVL
ncbi:MAG: succinylglutamate desuccinylase/aspartoacylase family protein, partial [Rhodospirillales bacterium]|nr:succinylglutamate desuccinylase/aspartoacylase family protein [Rhodospirillales bacterium]